MSQMYDIVGEHTLAEMEAQLLQSEVYRLTRALERIAEVGDDEAKAIAEVALKKIGRGW